MKKSLVCAAALAAVAPVFAQSSVQVYGVADVWAGSKTVKENGTKLYPESQTGLFDGGVSGSRFGFKGTEDLGGGLKAEFTLEQGFELDRGSQAEPDKAFNRQAWIGLAGGFGAVKLGRAYTAFDDVSGAASSVFDSALAPINNIFVSTWASTRVDNTIRYETPAFNGFSGAVSYSLGEDKTATTSATKLYALSAKYENGPLMVGAGYAKMDVDGEADLSVFDLGTVKGSLDATRLNVAYDFGVAKALASYGRAKAKAAGDSLRSNEWELGVEVPLAGNLALSAGYGRVTLKDNGVKIGKGNSLGAAVAYSLSKRTLVYAGFNQTKREDSPKTTELKQNIYAIGVKHTF
ncbi:porin [Tepidimonas sp.]|uniref:porin n=1 Tax=Tepidimonas sp. TaxID=2002775 RepID=UPI002FDF1F63